MEDRNGDPYSDTVTTVEAVVYALIALMLVGWVTVLAWGLSNVIPSWLAVMLWALGSAVGIRAVFSFRRPRTPKPPAPPRLK